MRPKHSGQPKASAERVVKDIRRATRRHFSAEDKIRIVLEGLRGDDSIYVQHCLGARDDAAGMQYLIPGWEFDPKRPCLVR